MSSTHNAATPDLLRAYKRRREVTDKRIDVDMDVAVSPSTSKKRCLINSRSPLSARLVETWYGLAHLNKSRVMWIVGGNLLRIEEETTDVDLMCIAE
ncbi:hypothetical protein CCFV1_ORF005 [Cotesia congregata filamentous virus 1]|uniref:Uncharacterized protein n=1 Tax=Cotesia congregata filamentous virus 1 TaxID=3064291 RepID=A0ABC8QJG4_9VIRU|nr:hypothetical protein CCFV1_ORF005 [Cotesia congregata filamentous virus 1]